MSEPPDPRRLQISRLVQLAIDHHENGQLKKAEELYCQVLQVEPGHADALHFLGLIAHQLGDSERAIAWMTRSIERDPHRALYFLNRGQVFAAKGACDQAIENYRQAALLDPNSELAYQKLGDALVKQGNEKEAAVSYSRALSINPNSPETINHLGALLYRAGRLEQAVVCYQKALTLKSNYAEAHNNLGVALKCLGRSAEAVASLERALQFQPTLAAAHANLGEIRVAQGDFEKAVESLERAIAFQPDLGEAYLNLGNAYHGQGQLARAVSSYEQAIRLSADGSGAYNNLAETLKDQDKPEEAVASFRRALQARPGCMAIYSNLLCLYAFTRCISPEAERTEAEAWEINALSEEERAVARLRANPGTGTFSSAPRQGRRLRLGIVSAELGAHAVAQFLLPFLAHLDRRRFHLTLFPTSRRSGPQAEEFQELADSYIPLYAMSDSTAADRIRSEQIDVLMDTTGHTFGERMGIFAHRSAPVQCTYIGYWSTTGLTEMDWVFGNPELPPSALAHFSERVWQLPRLVHCYRGEASLPESGWVPDPGGTVWLGSFNRLSKIRNQTLGLWAGVLHALPEAKLLFEDGARHEEETRRRILSGLAIHGIPAERTTFIPFAAGHERHMLLYDRLDIGLDTIPFNGITTSFDTLWMGVPLVALEGDWNGGLWGSAVLKAFGRRDWIAHNEAEYVSIVCSLARDVEARTSQRKSQRSQMLLSPLCDAKGMARCMEDALEGMYDHWVAGPERA